MCLSEGSASTAAAQLLPDTYNSAPLADGASAEMVHGTAGATGCEMTSPVKESLRGAAHDVSEGIAVREEQVKPVMHVKGRHVRYGTRYVRHVTCRP